MMANNIDVLPVKKQLIMAKTIVDKKSTTIKFNNNFLLEFLLADFLLPLLMVLTYGSTELSFGQNQCLVSVFLPCRYLHFSESHLPYVAKQRLHNNYNTFRIKLQYFS